MDQSSSHTHAPHAFEVICVQCGEQRWPILPEKSNTYVCVRCCSGVGNAKREAAKRSWVKRRGETPPPRVQQTTVGAVWGGGGEREHYESHS